MARYYGGGNGFLTTSSITNNIGTGDYSFHCWAKTTANNADSAIFCSGASLAPLFYINSSGTFAYYDGAANSTFTGSNIATSTDTDPSGWHGVGVCRRGTVVTLFYDGVPTATISGATGTFANDVMYFGVDSGGGGDPWDGLLCEQALWRGDIGDTAFQRLGNRYAPDHPILGIPRGWRIGYWPVYGNRSPEPDIWGANHATITSGVMQSGQHPKIIRYQRKMALGKAPAAGGAVFTLQHIYRHVAGIGA